MLKNFIDIIERSYCRTTFTLDFPSCCEDLKFDGSNFEMGASNMLQPVKLVYNHNIVTNAVAVIFVHTYTGGLLDDDTLIGGMPWKVLRLQIKAKSIDFKAYRDALSEEERINCNMLIKAQNL